MSAILAFVLSPIGRLVSIGLIAVTLGFTGGWRVHKKFTDSAALRAVTAAYQKRIARMEADTKAVNDAAQADAARAADEESKRVQAEERARALEDRLSAGVAFDADDADRVRELWSGPDPGAKRKASASAR